VSLLLFNKPYGVICQFSGDAGPPTLAKYIRVPEVYPAGRLDTDSEGLLLLTDDGELQYSISSPRAKMPKHYWVQVEGVPDGAALKALAAGVNLGDFVTRPAQVRPIAEPPNLWPRNPPIRFRAAIPTTWLELVISEGKNRQVRRMTAHVGHPTLRLIRHRIGPYSLEELAPGQWREAEVTAELLSAKRQAAPHPKRAAPGAKPRRAKSAAPAKKLNSREKSPISARSPGQGTRDKRAQGRGKKD